MESFDPYAPPPRSSDLSYDYERPGNDFFGAVLGEAQSPLGSFLDTISPYSFTQPQQDNPESTFWNTIKQVGGRYSSAFAGAPKTNATAQTNAQSSRPASAGSAVTDRNSRIGQRIVQEATRLGIDPEFALWVAQNEGGLDDGAANRQNAEGSEAYGPYQMLINGGVGDYALAAGIDPRDANTWEQQITFALEYAAQHGWGEWEAVTARGIDPRTGLPGGPAYAPYQPSVQPANANVRPASMPQGTAGSPYAMYATTDPGEYTIAFDFDAPYGGAQFNPDIPNHRGVDLVVRGAPNGGRGARVGALHSGQVVGVTNESNGGNGVIVLGDDGLYHRYFHFDSILVGYGDRIERGMPIGVLGASGTEGFPHLHYEVSRRMNGDPMGELIDPRPYLQGAR